VGQDPARMVQRRQIEQITAKLKQMASVFSEALEREIQPLSVTNETLLHGQSLLAADKDTLEAANRELRANMHQLCQTSDELDAWHASHQDDEEPTMEDMITFDNKASNQLVECIAADQAIQDTYRVLDSALTNQATDVEKYVLETRKLATKQFMVCALHMYTIRAGQGFGSSLRHAHVL